MSFSHNQNGAVKAYLLGTLSEDDSNALEQRYFCDKQFFRDVKQIELSLIVDYLEQRLNSADRKRFEERYLHVPALRQRLHQVREARLSAAQTKSSWHPWRVVAFACALAVGVWIPYSLLHQPGTTSKPPVQLSQLEKAPVYRLMPGVSKGSDTTPSVVPSPAGVDFVLELPGVRASIDCNVAIVPVGTDTQTNVGNAAIWVNEKPLRSEPAPGGQELTVHVAPGRLPHADYIIEVKRFAGSVLEKYVIRVAAP